MTTPRLGAPELSTSQASKEATINETFYWLDAASMGGLKVIDRDLATPPGSPAQGDCYIMPAAPAGAWALASEDDIALYIGTAWEIRTPQEGWEAWVVDEAVKVAFSSGAWGIIGTFSGAAYVPTAGGTMTGDLVVPAEAYGVGWNGSNEVPTKDAVYDKIETLAGSIPGAYTDEQAQDAVGTILTDTGLAVVTYNDAAPSIDVNVPAAAASDLNTGTDTSKAVTSDALAGSNFGKAVVTILVTDPAGSAITTGDGKAYYRVPSTLNGMNLVSVAAALTTVSSSGIPTVQIANVTDAVDMLSTKLTVDASETDSSTAATAAVIDTTKDDVATGDMLRIDIDVAGTGAKGLIVEMQFQLP